MVEKRYKWDDSGKCVMCLGDSWAQNACEKYESNDAWHWHCKWFKEGGKCIYRDHLKNISLELGD